MIMPSTKIETLRTASHGSPQQQSQQGLCQTLAGVVGIDVAIAAGREYDQGTAEGCQGSTRWEVRHAVR
jgi:hypothetical protein